MKRAATTPMKRANRLEPSEEVIRQVQREEEEILMRLLQVQAETLREPRASRPGLGLPPNPRP